jgi:hypothetical protein
VFVGCSHTFGVGLPAEYTWCHLVAKQLNMELQYINLGIPGSGPDSQIINLYWVLNNYRVAKVFWFMSNTVRQIIYRDNKFVAWSPNKTTIFGDRDLDAKFLEVTERLADTRDIKTRWDLYGIFSRLHKESIPTWTSCWIESQDQDLDPLRQEFSIKPLARLNKLDLARDNWHFGAKSHEDIKNQIISNMIL